jgi:flagellar biosynthetic protein FliP
MICALWIRGTWVVSAEAATTDEPAFGFSITTGDEEDLAGSIQIIIILTIIALAPSILILMTSFLRIIIVLSFTRQAVGTQSAPPNQVLIGMALFLTLFIMAPVFSRINTNALEPLNAGTISQEEAFSEASGIMKEFMLGQTDEKDLSMMLEIGNYEIQEDPLDYSLLVVIPSFILSELRRAFIIGFLIYIPFIVIDMVVASVLMSMGMMMLPPTTISMPFKILLFVLADGWNLIIGELMRTFVSV